jgi:hypothetical protein
MKRQLSSGGEKFVRGLLVLPELHRSSRPDMPKITNPGRSAPASEHLKSAPSAPVDLETTVLAAQAGDTWSRYAPRRSFTTTITPNWRQLNTRARQSHAPTAPRRSRHHRDRLMAPIREHHHHAGSARPVKVEEPQTSGDSVRFSQTTPDRGKRPDPTTRPVTTILRADPVATTVHVLRPPPFRSACPLTILRTHHTLRSVKRLHSRDTRILRRILQDRSE